MVLSILHPTTANTYFVPALNEVWPTLKDLGERGRKGPGVQLLSSPRSGYLLQQRLDQQGRVPGQVLPRTSSAELCPEYLRVTSLCS